MSNGLSLILTTSLVGLGCVLIYAALGRRQTTRLVSMLIIAIAAVAVVVFVAPARARTRGTIDETAAVVICYASMLLGMAAEYGYAQAERGQKHFTWEPMTFLMPIFASPIVFIPLLTISGEVAAGGAFSRAKLMVYLVAFQNGFFWKRFFEERRRELGEAPRPVETHAMLT